MMPRQARRPVDLLAPLVAALAPAACAPPVDPPPDTDIVVFDIYPHEDHVHVGSMIPVTERTGYDNQPFFVDDDRLLFTSMREGERTDVYRFDLRTEELERVTTTEESEYSPRLTPDGEAISVVRVEMDGVSQHLYRYPLDGGEPERLLPELDDIGYYAWAGEETVLLFRVADPSRLYRADVRTGEVEPIQERVGRSLQSIPGTAAASFVDQRDDDRWILRRVDGTTGTVDAVAELPVGSEEHAWISSATVILGHEGGLHRFVPDGDGRWIPLVDLEPYVGPFSRIAASPSGRRIAVVVEKGEGV